MPKELIDALVTLFGFTSGFLFIMGVMLGCLIFQKILYYCELTKEVRLCNHNKELKPKKVVIVKDETK